MLLTGSVLGRRLDEPRGAGGWGASPWGVGAGTAWEDGGEVGVGRGGGGGGGCWGGGGGGWGGGGCGRGGGGGGGGGGGVGLVLFYGLFWGVSVMVHAALLLVQYRRRGDLDVVESGYWQAAGV